MSEPLVLQPDESRTIGWIEFAAAAEPLAEPPADGCLQFHLVVEDISPPVLETTPDAETTPAPEATPARNDARHGNDARRRKRRRRGNDPRRGRDARCGNDPRCGSDARRGRDNLAKYAAGGGSSPCARDGTGRRGSRQRLARAGMHASPHHRDRRRWRRGRTSCAGPKPRTNPASSRGGAIGHRGGS